MNVGGYASQVKGRVDIGLQHYPHQGLTPKEIAGSCIMTYSDVILYPDSQGTPQGRFPMMVGYPVAAFDECGCQREGTIVRAILLEGEFLYMIKEKSTGNIIIVKDIAHTMETAIHFSKMMC